MNTPHTSRLVSPHAAPAPKAAELDRDRSIVLTEDVAASFATIMNERFSRPQAQALFSGEKAAQFAQIISAEALLPFTASVVDGSIVLAPALHKMHEPVLKDISDGVTHVCKSFAAQTYISEGTKFSMGILFQPAIHTAYQMAGMPEGAHTKYTHRSC